MPTNITDVDTFTDPIQGPADADAQTAASYNLGFQGLANRTRNLKNKFNVGGELAYSPQPSRVRTLPAFAGLAASVGGREFPDWVVSTSGSPPNQGMILRVNRSTGTPNIEITDARLLFPLFWFVPVESTITRIRALVKPGLARGAGDRMKAFYFTQQPSFLAGGSHALVGPLASDEDDGTTNLQILDTGVISYAVSFKTGPNLVYCVNSGQTGSTTVSDEVYAIELTYSDPGPRSL
jgi:hypothetical protein